MLGCLLRRLKFHVLLQDGELKKTIKAYDFIRWEFILCILKAISVS